MIELGTGLGFSTPFSNYEIGGLNDIGQMATILDTRAMAHFQWNTGRFFTL
ncbi:MAG: hypothetical protein H0X63_07985 [Flavobacteriales bacterium]|jgi:hypothetical protein|nr:hypothetical protein [Flavobacteriales bacterium]